MDTPELTRRELVGGLVGTLALVPVAASAAEPGPGEVNRSASAERFPEAERAILAGRTPLARGIHLDIPTLSENGNSVDVAIKVDSPWTREDHIRTIHILSEQNPFPRLATFHLNHRAGRAEVATRIRLAFTQRVVVLAETTAGAVHRGEHEVIVTIGACVEGG